MDESLNRQAADRLLKSAADGSESAADELFKKCGPAVFRIIRRRMGLRSARFDSGDVAQAVWASFFGNREKLRDFDTLEDVTSYLAAMAFNKVQKARRHHQLTEKRAESRETRIDPGELPHRNGPSPSQLAIADETWERLLAELPLSQQRILHMRLEGKTQEDIAQDLGISVRTVSRIISRLQQRMKQ